MPTPPPLPEVAEDLAKYLVRLATKLAEQRGEGFGSGSTFTAGSSGRISDRTALLAMRTVTGGVDQTEADYRAMRRALSDIRSMAARHGIR